MDGWLTIRQSGLTQQKVRLNIDPPIQKHHLKISPLETGIFNHSTSLLDEHRKLQVPDILRREPARGQRRGVNEEEKKRQHLSPR